MTTISNLDVNLDGFSDFNTTYGTGSWDEAGWQNSLSIYDNSGADVFNANVDLSGSDWTIRSMNIGASLGSTLHLNDLDDGMNRTIKALFIGGSSIINLSTTNIGHIWGGGDSQEVSLGSGSVRNIDLYAIKNTISTGSGFIMGISTAGLSYIDVAEGCGIGSIFTDYGSEVHITLHDQSFVDYIQVCGENSSIEFNGYVDVASVRLEGASISVGDGYVGSILNYAGGGSILVDSGSVGSIQSWNDGMTIQLGTDSNIGSIQSSENGMHLNTNGDVKFISATGDIGGNEILIGEDGWVQDIWLNGEANQVEVSGSAESVHTGSGDDVVTVNSGGWVKYIDFGDGDNTAFIDGVVDSANLGNGYNTVILGINSRINTLFGSSGDDVVTLVGDSRILQLKLDGGNNVVTTDVGNIESYYSYGGNNTLNIGTGGVQQIVLSGDGVQNVTSEGFIGSLQCYDNSSSTVSINGGALNVLTAKGDDRVTLGAGQWIGQLFTWEGNDIVTMGTDSAIDTCNLDGGDDIFQFNTILTNEFGLIRGDKGRDLADFSQVAAGVTISMNLNGALQTLGAGQVGLVEFEDLTGSSGADRLEGSAEANQINGLAGSDRIFGLGGNDTLYGGAGNDSIDGGDGDDALFGGLGSDTLAGGAGYDRLIHNSETRIQGVVVSFTSVDAGTVTEEGGAADTFTGIEDVIGSLLNDSMTGNVGNQVFNGDAGNDSLYGGAGDDGLYGVTGNDSIDGGVGDDALYGGLGSDTLAGGAGNDSMAGGANDDTYTVDSSADVVTESQNEGTDTVLSSISYVLAANAENLTLTGNTAINGAGNTLSNLLTGNAAANSISGGGGNDTIIGGGGNDILEGAAGNDSLVGGAGNDTLLGSGGNDKLTGGSGADVFVFNSAPNASSNMDTIADFVSGTDRISLAKSVMVALGTINSTLIADAFWQGSGVVKGHDSSDRIVYNTSTGALYYDADGSGSGAAVLLAQLGTTASHPLSLTAADFFVF